MTVKSTVHATNSSRYAMLYGALLIAGILSGCQMPRKLISETKSPVCSGCRTVTRTTPFKGINYVRNLCPGCKTVRDWPENWRDCEAFVKVHVCTLCKDKLMECPVCAPLQRKAESF